MAIQENPYLPPVARVADAVVAESEGEFIEGGRGVPAGNGSSWIGAGWRMYRADAGTWVLITLILMMLSLGLSVIPFLGNFIVTLVMPVFLGGLMLACRKSANGERVLVGDLFTGFQTALGPLLIVGAITMALTVAAGAIAGGLVFGLASAGGMGMGMNVVFFVLVFLALIIPVQMALWFAPALVVLQQITPGQALKQSFLGCLKNIIPFLLYGVILLPLALVASLPMLLGWLVLGPVVICSAYAAYRDIYFR